MELLQMCKDIFDVLPKGTSIKEFFSEMRALKSSEQGNTDENFFNLCVHYLGGRSYNGFLDYSLFAIKLNVIYNNHCWLESDCSGKRMEEAIMRLLMDDRHDMWQNIPYALIDVAKGLPSDKKEAFWSDIVDALIDCVNIKGTGDISPTFKVLED